MAQNHDRMSALPFSSLTCRASRSALRNACTYNGVRASIAPKLMPSSGFGNIHSRSAACQIRCLHDGSLGKPHFAKSSSSAWYVAGAGWRSLAAYATSGLVVCYLYNSSRRPTLHNEAPESPQKIKSDEASLTHHDLEEYDRDERFAKSVEDMESDERRLHANAFVRTFYKTGDFVHAYIIEPFGTTKRFFVLVLLFLPVLVTTPMIFIGRRREGGRRRGRRMEKAEGGQRWGALWWYGFLVKQMERAGPTFIKVCTVEASVIS